MDFRTLYGHIAYSDPCHVFIRLANDCVKAWPGSFSVSYSVHTHDSHTRSLHHLIQRRNKMLIPDWRICTGGLGERSQSG